MQNNVQTKVIILDVDHSGSYPCILNLDEITEEIICVNVVENFTACMLIKDCSSSHKKLSFILKENAYLTLNLLALDNTINSEYTFELESGAKIEAALADFASGASDLVVKFYLNGEHSDATWHLASFATNKDKKIYDVSFIHNQKNTSAHMSSFGVVEGNGRINFSGINHIINGAIKSKTSQQAKIMVFDELCVATASPILKIDENDVEASHASVVGKVNEEHLFYLCSRGLSEAKAKKLITSGYLLPIANYFYDEAVKRKIVNAIEMRM